MNTYAYTDNSKKKILFTCEADCILQADKDFTVATGIMPAKAPWIGCSIFFAKPDKE